ncbi:DinB family protein [Actinomadura sp. NPDC048394]|uniref:DinB family protein n=1 Tax=Actinomadura sp. NPDC048394 TaxID=3158223 RepID=UPI0033D81A67
MDTTRLRAAYGALLDAAATVKAGTAPPPGEWTADQILAHVSLITATTLAAASAVASGAHAAYDNRIALDTWTIDRVVALAGGTAGLVERLRRQADALCALGGPALSDAELDTPVPARLLSNGACLVDQPLPLRDLLAGLAETELPGHTRQLLDRLPAATGA